MAMNRKQQKAMFARFKNTRFPVIVMANVKTPKNLVAVQNIATGDTAVIPKRQITRQMPIRTTKQFEKLRKESKIFPKR